MARGANDVGSILYQSKGRTSKSHPSPYTRSTSSTRPQPINQISKGTLSKHEFFIEVGEKKRKAGKIDQKAKDPKNVVGRSAEKVMEGGDHERPTARKNGSKGSEEKNDPTVKSRSAGLPITSPLPKRHPSDPESSSSFTAHSSSNRHSDRDSSSCYCTKINVSSMVTNLEEQAEEWGNVGLDNERVEMGTKGVGNISGSEGED